MRRQPSTFSDITNGFPANWRLKNGCRNYVLMAYDYPNLALLLIGRNTWKICFNQSEALPLSALWYVISMESLRSLLRRRFVGKPVVASWNVGCYLRLQFKRLLMFFVFTAFECYIKISYLDIIVYRTDLLVDEKFLKSNGDEWNTENSFTSLNLDAVL